LASPRLEAKQGQISGWKSLDFLGFPWILSLELRLINGLRAIFCGNIFMPVPGRQRELSRPSRAVRAAVQSVPRQDVSGVDFRDFLFQSGPDRLPVPSPASMTPPRLSGKKMSVFPIP
jgi:hypothetical protein